MKTVNKKLYQRILNLGFAFVLALSSVTTGLSLALSQTVAAAPGIVENINTSEVFTSIQDAIDDAETLNGHTIFVQNGTYDENLNVSKSLTIEGESQAGVVVVANDGGYGIENTVDGLNLAFKNLTLLDSLHYGFKLTGSDAVLENVTARNSSKTEFDFNGMLSVHLKNVRAYGENTSGNGFSFTNSDNLTLENVFTRDNAWGGVALYPYGVHYPVGIDNVSISGLNTNESNPLYIQVGAGGTPVTNFSAPQFKYAVTNDEFRADGSQFTLYQRNLSQATNFALSLHEAPNVSNLDSVITRVSDDFKFVPAGLQLANAVEAVTDGGTVRILSGEHAVDDAQIVINKDVQIIGSSTGSTVMKLQHDTASSGDGRGWFRVTPGNELKMKSMTLDGNGHKVYIGLHFDESDGDVRNVAFKEIRSQESGSPYNGLAVRVDPNSDVDIRNSSFEGIGRVGVLYKGLNVTGDFANNTYTGKGNGDWLDYALDISAGAVINVTNNTISNNTGIAASDGSSSAGVLVSTYFDPGTKATLKNNTLIDNTTGLYVGYNSADTSSVIARNNVIKNNEYGVVRIGTPLIDARKNYWGSNSGPNDSYSDSSVPVLNESGEGNEVYGNVWYDDWNTQEVPAPVLLSPLNNTPINGTTPTSNDWEDVTGVSIQHYTYQSYNVLADGSCNTSSIRWTENYINSETNSRTLADGLQYCWRVKAVDNDGNESIWSDLWKTVVDNTGPEVGDILLNGQAVSLSDVRSSNCSPISKFYTVNGEIDLTATLSDAVAGVSNAKYKVRKVNASGCTVSSVFSSGNVGMSNTTGDTWEDVVGFDTDDVPMDGEYTIYLQMTDNAGNTTLKYVDIAVDNTAPTGLAHLSPSNGTITTTAGLASIDWTDALDSSLPVSYYYQSSHFSATNPDGSFVSPVYNSGSLSSSSIPTPGTPEGVYYWHVKAVDAAGNSTGWTAPWMVTVDNSAPVVEITSPTVDLTNGDVEVRASVSDANLRHYWFQIKKNGSVIKSQTVLSSGITDKLLYTLTEDGEYTITVAARDLAGGTASSGNRSVDVVKTVTIDTTAPVVDITDALDSATVGHNALVPITGTSDDAVSYTLSIDGTPVQTEADEAVFTSYDWDTTGFASGVYVITFEGTDAAGNPASDSVTITVDNTAPALTVGGYTGTSLTPTITGTTDGADDVVTVDGVLATVDTVVNGDGTYDWTYTFPTQTTGTHDIEVVSTDTYGNAITVPGTITVEEIPATETTPATISTTVTPDPDNATTNTDDQEVLGAQTEGDNSDTKTVSEDILGTSDQNDSEWTIFGLAWYWWLLILAGLAALYALWRRRSEANA